MQGFIQQLKRKLRYFYVQGYRKSRPFLYWLTLQYHALAHYFKTHPRVRKWTIILAPPATFLLLLLLVVWIETPSKKELRNIQNQVASEVYSADSVLLGRYFIQDRTEVKYQDIAPVVVDALIATEDVRF
jgi:penicillin-binding protein 1A